MGGEYKTNVPKGSFTQGVCSSLNKLVKEIEKSSGDGASNVGEVPPPQLSFNGAEEEEKELDGAGEKELAGTGSNNDAEVKSFQNGGLEAHNKFRKIHNSTALKLNRKMCKEAEDYAKALAKKGRLQHAGVKDGENLAFACSRGSRNKFSGAEATKNWYDLGYRLVSVKRMQTQSIFKLQ